MLPKGTENNNCNQNLDLHENLFQNNQRIQSTHSQTFMFTFCISDEA